MSQNRKLKLGYKAFFGPANPHWNRHTQIVILLARFWFFGWWYLCKASHTVWQSQKHAAYFWAPGSALRAAYFQNEPEEDGDR